MRVGLIAREYKKATEHLPHLSVLEHQHSPVQAGLVRTGLASVWPRILSEGVD